MLWEHFVDNCIENSKLDSYRRKVDKSIAITKEAIGMGISWYVAWSGGKDSTVLAHLVNEQVPGIPVWSEKDDCDFPGELDYVLEVAKKYNFNLALTQPESSLWDMLDSYDIFEDLHSRGTRFSDSFFYSAVEEQMQKYDGCFLGLRTEESKSRLWNYKKHGYIYKKKDGKYICTPLANWKAIDVFTYLIANDIPVLDVYKKTKFSSPEQIRKAWVLPSKQAKDGYCVWLRYYYPELYNKLARRFPKIKNYV